MRSVSALRKLSTMQPASVLRNIRGIKAPLEKPEVIPKFANIVLSPNTRTMLAKKFGWTFVW
jgi:hypothetical protein